MYPKKRLEQKIDTDVESLGIGRAFVAHFSVADPEAAAVANVLTATTLADGETTVVTTGITDPDYPRALQIKGNAAGISGDAVIVGTNYNDEDITETITANGTTVVLGTKAFKTVTSITLPARNAADDTISVGVTDKLGIPFELEHNTVLRTFFGNALEGTAPTVTVDADEIEKNTIDLNTALDGSKVDVYLLV